MTSKTLTSEMNKAIAFYKDNATTLNTEMQIFFAFFSVGVKALITIVAVLEKK